MAANRRRFLGAAAGFGVSRLLAAAKYDLIIRNGRVIDPSRDFDQIADVAIARGRIAATGAKLSAAGIETIDAAGKLVAPGLIDIHTHATRDPDGPRICLNDGVVGWIDAGTQGADGIDQAVAAARRSPQPARVLINIGRRGVIPEGDTMDLSRADVDLARKAIERNRDMIAGVKARLSRDVAGQNDYEVLRRAQQVASAFRMPVMIHMGQTMSPLSRLIPLLRPGDIVTHMFAPPPNSIIDDDGRILPVIQEARRRGVVFDVGNGRTGHLRWDIAEKVLTAGFAPDTISTDWTPEGRTAQVFNLPNVMSKLVMLGLPLTRVIACATMNAARVFPVFHGGGTLAPGARADVAILEMREGNFEFEDNFGNRRTGRVKLFPAGTVLNGKRIAN
ncbi:MAG TPA: amidohydrolase family protein [Bryobacteraceae bacterium]|jgi:dihydroorotase|nr:amidohydrolase family protein [Bryobacteraceae bacterium]